VPEHERRPNEVLGGSVTIVSVDPGREDDVAAALSAFPGPPALDALPVVIYAKTTTERAAEVATVLEEAGARVEVEEVWVTREIAPDTRPRPACPNCGSTKTQPFTFSGSGGRANMKCTACGQLFKERHA
jgi:tRNA(Ile2) C34 agmatinyltransferase TiaS